MKSSIIITLLCVVISNPTLAAEYKELIPGIKVTRELLHNNYEALKDELQGLRTLLLSKKEFPKGAVLAFYSDACPTGWHSFKDAEGRMVVGSGRGKGLTARIIGDIGGTENHKLLKDEMPSHNHGGATGNVSNKMAWPADGAAAGKFSGNVGFSNKPHSHSINYEGNGSPHNNMPPFIVLRYCIKS
jgi:hypothetical protein